MKVFFAASSDVSQVIKKQYRKMVDIISSQGCDVSDVIFDNQTTKKIIGNNITHENIHDLVINKINQSDILVADISYPSGGVGYQIYHAFYQKKPIIIMYSENNNTNPSVIIRGISSKRVQIFKYNSFTEIKNKLPRLIKNSVKKIKVRFNLILTNRELSFLNEQAESAHMSTTRILRKIIKEYWNSLKTN